MPDSARHDSHGGHTAPDRAGVAGPWGRPFRRADAGGQASEINFSEAQESPLAESGNQRTCRHARAGPVSGDHECRDQPEGDSTERRHMEVRRFAIPKAQEGDPSEIEDNP